MMKNDYRRALILLRGNAPGYSGHVRLERRTLMGSMYFLLQAAADCRQLCAALVGRGRDSYYACKIGEMSRDSRGQAVLGYSFDPRNICGRELEQYQLVVVGCADGNQCEILLYGNISGHADMNWEQVRAALCSLYAPQDTPAAGLPDAQPVQPEAMEVQADPPEKPQQVIPEETVAEQEQNQAQIYSDSGDSDYDDNEAGDDLPFIDVNTPWPESIEPLRPMFKVSVPLENPPDDEYRYIAVSMPEGSGYAHCAVGVLAQDGTPVSVRYALPAAWTPQPPAGLEDYIWVGDQNRGWWMTQLDVYNCCRN